MENQKFSISKRIKSFKYALQGLKTLLIEEHNARIHVLVAILVVCLGRYLKISSVEWLIIILAIGFVLSMEALNSAIENLADFISPDKHSLIKKVKDLSAGAVLISAISAICIGCVIFIPKVVDLFYK
jgi:undecaprenol kinase/diacylglycerol kinase (ATP)